MLSGRGLLLCVVLYTMSHMAHAATSRKGRVGRQSGRTTVISCRVFRKGVCRKTKSNIILVNKSISSSYKCQQFCYATPGCSAFTHFEQSAREDRKCVLFRDCNGKLSDCDDCISGPIMPRITECIAARQEVAPSPPPPPPTEPTGKPCSSGCTGLCLGPRCPELLAGLNTTSSTSPNAANIDDSRAAFNTDKETEDSSDSAQEAPEEQGETGETLAGDTFTATDTGAAEYDYDDSDYFADDTNYDEDVDVNFDEGSGGDDDQTEYIDDSEDYFNVETPVDLPLDVNAIDEPEEEDEEVDINIDEGFLSDSSGDPVNVPAVETVEPRFGSTSEPSSGGGNTFIFFFCALGGHNSGGAVSLVDLINTGLGNAAQSLSLSPLPPAVMRGGEVSARYSSPGTITTCGNGFTILSPYGYIYKPGECYDLNVRNNDWQETGAALTSFRKGATITKLGRYLLATGGVRKRRALNTIEAFDPKRPERGWKKLEKLSMPAAVSEHCTVTVEGRKGKEVVITGGRGRENRALKLDVNNQRWYSLNRMTTGRRRHACVKAKINGRPGLVVSGGSGRRGQNMTSVEFFDALTGEWLSLPPLNRGRRSHVMTVTKGKLLVAGGEGRGRAGKEFLDDMEVFNGRRWITSRQKLDRPRANFSLVKIPKRKSRSVKQTKKTSRRKNKRNRSPRRN